MTMRYPTDSDIPALRRIWKEAFGDSDAFLDSFFAAAFSPERCRIADENGAKSVLYWFDCTLDGRRFAYLYAVATDKASRGRGLCRSLMADTHGLLKSAGFAGAILVPGEESLFGFYRGMGYRAAASVDAWHCAGSSEEKCALEILDAESYARLRRDFLPVGGVIQEGQTLSFLAGFAQFVKGAGFLAACTAEDGVLSCHEMLFTPPKAPTICFQKLLSAMNCTRGHFRTPGTSRPFAMWLPLQADAPAPRYFGLALD